MTNEDKNFINGLRIALLILLISDTKDQAEDKLRRLVLESELMLKTLKGKKND